MKANYNKLKILWLTSISCNGNSHSFLNYPQLAQILDSFEFIYHPILDSKYSLEDILSKDLKCDILIIEGTISPEYKKVDIPIINLINKYSVDAKCIVTVGTCATFGGIFKHSGYSYATGLHFDETNQTFLFKNIKSKTISISGCPIQPEILANTLYSIKNDIPIQLDEYNRPVEYFKYTVHNGCTRNEYFEYKVDNHRFGHKEGCMFYDHGCSAPYTQGSCNKILWNEVNSKTRNGEPCHGCTSADFPRYNFYTTKKNMGIPASLPLDVPKRAYLTLAGVTKAFKIKRLEEDLF
jgi:hydrogenase small subunit